MHHPGADLGDRHEPGLEGHDPSPERASGPVHGGLAQTGSVAQLRRYLPLKHGEKLLPLIQHIMVDTGWLAIF